MCKDITMDIFDLGLTLIDEREIYQFFLEVVRRAGHDFSLEKLENKMLAFAKENIIM